MTSRIRTRPRIGGLFGFETLEIRLNLAGDTCLLEFDAADPAARAARSVNCFAMDLYEHYQREDGNLVLSPFSIATALAMAYAGADGQTAAEMEDVLHLGSEPGIHDSFRSLLDALLPPAGANAGFVQLVANAMWPDIDLAVKRDYTQTVQTDYHGEVQGLDYSNPEQAKETINNWVAQHTEGRIQDLIPQLDPATILVLTNSVYFAALWEFPFDPEVTAHGTFHAADGATVSTSFMFGEFYNTAPFTEIDGRIVVDLPFAQGRTSMVLVVPQTADGPNELTPELMVQINKWAQAEREADETFGWMQLRLPKFKTTVSSNLEEVLARMGMPSAFGPADFSKITDFPIWIEHVRHKVFLEVNEQGTEAAAATSVNFLSCFAAGTPVLTPDGEQPIEQLKVGDYVLSRNEFNSEGPVQRRRIEETFHGYAELIQLHLGGQVIRVTKDHRFYLIGQGWTKAVDLRPGDRLSADLRSWLTVDDVVDAGENGPVFNFRVAQHHTYFVGSESWGFGVWTHNCYFRSCIIDVNHPFQFFVRDNATQTILFMGRIDDPTQLENSFDPSVLIPGDSNGDGLFDSSDLVTVFQAGKYEDGIPDNATFDEGDWNQDGEFDSGDFVYAFKAGHYEGGAAPLESEIAAAVDAVLAQMEGNLRHRAFVA